MNVKPGEKESVILLPSNVTMKQSLDMVLFTITYYDLVNAKDLEEGIRMTITLKRKIMSEMMTTYFPSFLLMMITYATTFFKPFFFEAALSVNLTTMLVMTTIFISKMEGLPPTSATKMIDYWLILCQLVPFAQVVLFTAMEYIREEEVKESKDDGKETKETMSEQKQGPKPKEAWKHPMGEIRDVGTQIEGSDRELNEMGVTKKKGHILSRLILIGTINFLPYSTNDPLHPQRTEFSPLQSLSPSLSTLPLPQSFTSNSSL